MGSKLNETFFEQVTRKMMKNKSVFGAVLCVENGDSSISWLGGAGNIKAEDRYFIASVTKLYVTAVMLMLRAENILSFADKIYRYFPEELINGIHVLDGVDYTKEITIAHLLSNTSGIPDY
ncbi:MAG: serine hydrolase, partial [Bellilinea sp.]